MTVDGTDCPIREPQPFSAKWFSHKFRGAGLRYEVPGVGVCIQTGNIVWVNGPFPAGAWSDLKIFKAKLAKHLPPGEMVEADGTYRHPKCRLPQEFVSYTDKRAKNKARARHETVNKRLKQFEVLKQKFRHPICNHRPCFEAATVFTQQAFNRGHVQYTAHSNSRLSP